MPLLFHNGRIYDSGTHTFFPGEMVVDEASGLIRAVSAAGNLPHSGVTPIDLHGLCLAPGLLDVHTHGRAGGDFVTADGAALARMSRSYLSAGVTTVMPTLASAPPEEYGRAADRIADTPTDGTRFAGLHLEGRYLNPARRGAHASALLAPLDAAELSALAERMRAPYTARGRRCPLRVSAALELDRDGAFSAAAKKADIRLSLGHTEADYDTALAAVKKDGVRGFTHLYNAMPPLHHRAGGAVAACFDAARQGLPVFGELICDGFHISREMIRLAYALLGNAHTVLVSDSMEGTGCPDGNYTIAGMSVLLRDGKAMTEDGHLAGSTLNLFDGLCNLMEYCSISLAEALPTATENPAALAGLSDFAGKMAPGRFADLLVIDDSLPRPRLKAVYVGGRKVLTLC